MLKGELFNERPCGVTSGEILILTSKESAWASVLVTPHCPRVVDFCVGIPPCVVFEHLDKPCTFFKSGESHLREIINPVIKEPTYCGSDVISQLSNL